MKAHARFSALLSALIWLTLSAFAQDYRATIIGLVADTNKAAIPNAKVKVTNERTGVRRARLPLDRRAWRRR
jgi:hypothetical protein